MREKRDFHWWFRVLFVIPALIAIVVTTGFALFNMRQIKCPEGRTLIRDANFSFKCAKDLTDPERGQRP